MAKERLRRFENLERPRREGALGSAPRPRPSGRFEAVDASGQPAATPGPARPAPRPDAFDGVPDGTRERFEEPKERPLETAELPDEEQPFTRCCQCEMDNNRSSAQCTQCGADLQTDPQRIFNERLWAERRRESAELERASAERRAAAAQAEAEAAQARRKAAEEMAREVARRERERLDADADRDGYRGWDWGGSWGEPRDPTPLGIRLLRMIRDPRWRLGVSIAVAVAVVALVGAAFAVRRFEFFYVVIALVAALFSPRRRYGRWRRW